MATYVGAGDVVRTIIPRGNNLVRVSLPSGVIGTTEDGPGFDVCHARTIVQLILGTFVPL